MPRRAERARIGRPYDAASTGAILRATLAVVAERGYHATTLDEIAARAGSSKPTLYRRWTGKPQVVGEAIRHALAQANPAIPRTADPRADVRTVLHNLIAALTGTPLGRAIRSLIDVAEHEPELASCLATVERDRRAVLRGVLARALPLAARRDLDLEIDLLLGTIYFRFLVRRVAIPRRLAEALIARLIPPAPALRRARSR